MTRGTLKATLLVMLLGSASTMMQAQNSGPGLIARVLTASSVRELSVPSFSSWGYPFSDRDHNIYFHYDTGRFDEAALLKLSLNDSNPVIYKLPRKDSDAFLYGAASVTPAGEVWMVCSKEEKGAYLFSFSSDGKPNAPTELQVQDGLRPQSLVAISSNAFLVSGYFGYGAPKALQGDGFLGLFNDSGNLIKKFDGIRDKTDLGGDGSKPQTEGGVAGLNGNVYFLSAKQITVLSSTGEIVKMIPLPLVNVPKGAEPMRLFESGGYLMVQLTAIDRKRNGYHDNRYLLMDESTGEGLALYAPSPELGNVAVDFSRDTGLIFSKRNHAGKLQLITAELK